MDLAMENSGWNQHNLSGYSSGSRTTIEERVEVKHGCNWTSGWSPMVDWETFSACQDDDFKEFMESIFEEDEVSPPSSSNCNSSGSSTEMLVVEEDQDEIAINGGEDVKGLRLVHLLIAAAEAVVAANERRELARVILVRLKELVSPVDGTTMERLAAYFTEGLYGLLEGTRLGSCQNSRSHTRFINCGPHHHDQNPTDIIAAFQLLQDMSPYVKFGHFTANQAILESVSYDRRVHIVDYDIMEGIQWASLMQALVSRKDGTPAPHLRITALSRSGSARSSIGTVQETGRRLVAFAASIGQPFSFHQCRLDSEETFRPSGLKLVKGETLIINCMLHLPHFHHRAADSVASFLSGSKTLNPKLVTLVEEEVGPTDGSFVSRFMDSLHHYCAIYDSLEAGFPMNYTARALVERVFLGPRISGSLSRIFRTREGGEEGSWADRLSAAGFRSVGISFSNHCQARLLLGLFNDGYRAENVGENRLVLGWKSRRLLSSSVWTFSSSDGS